jgi:hypothetical protein
VAVMGFRKFSPDQSASHGSREARSDHSAVMRFLRTSEEAGLAGQAERNDDVNKRSRRPVSHRRRLVA